MVALYVIVGILFGGIVAYFVARPKKMKEDGTGFQLLLAQLNSLQNTVDQKLGQSHKEVSETLRVQSKESNDIIRDITDRLARLDETNRQVVGFTQQLRELQDILKNPKQRGILGEYYLETLLKNVLPPRSYQMQYSFPDGTIVDAVVFVKDKIIPIDSKFSLENYNRLSAAKDPAERTELERLFKSDLKKRIDETSKYVKPEADTMDFAFMFIPHEAIYYDLLVSNIGGVAVETRDLIEYAFKDRHVIIVSPTSFLAFLQTVLQGLKALQIEESAKEIMARVEMLGRHLKTYEAYHTKMGTSLGTVVNHFNASQKALSQVDKDVLKITGASPELETVTLPRPELLEDEE
jgi:DNA recombination protein RmuC